MNFNRKVILMLFIAVFITSTFAMTRSVHAALWNVVPGPNAIQNAINAAAPFDTINVAAGIYPEAITIPAAKHDISLIGAPGAIIQPVAANPPQDGVDRDGIYILANGVKVQGFEIDGTNGFVTINGIYGLNTNGLTLTGNVIHDLVNNAADNGGVGILVFGYEATCNNNVISGNVVYNTGRMGIIICAWSDVSGGWLVCSGNTISWNVVYNTWQGPTNDGGGGIQVNGAKNTLIYDNQVHDTQTAGSSWLKTGIYIYGSDTGNKITCNDVYKNKYGIVTWIDAGGGVVGLTATTPAIENNNIYQNTAYGVYNVAAPTLDATKNWWDSKNGPGSVGPGSGDHVGANVDYSSYSNSPASCAPHFTLTVASAHDSPTTTTSNVVVGANVAPPGWIVTASVTTETVGGTRYVCTGWTGGTGDVPSTGTTASVTFTVTQDSTITWNWKTQYQVNFAQTGLSSDASGTVLTVGATTYAYSTFPSSAMWLDDGTAYSYTSTVPAGTGKQYVLTGVTGPTSPIHSGGTVTGNYNTQYKLTVTSPYDSPTGAGWYDSGSTATSTVTSPVGNEFVAGWTGTGSAPAHGLANTVTFTITQASTVTWNWVYSPILGPSVGGQWQPITMQALTSVNMLGLLAPWIALALIAAATALATYRRLLKKHL